MKEQKEECILEINGLSKFYGSVRALNNLDAKINKGQVLGILGPNGSGKTTTLALLLGLFKPSSGNFNWFPSHVTSVNPNKKIGALLETPNFYPYLNAIDNLKITSHIKNVGTEEIDKLLRQVNLFDRRFSKFQSFSLGMKQRLAIAASLIGDPEIILFDEPTNGLDPQGISEIRSLINRISDQGKTIIMASHILEEVEKTCSHVLILRKGKLLAHGPVGDIMNSNPKIDINSDQVDLMKTTFSNQVFVQSIEFTNRNYRLYLNQDIETALINKIAFEAGITLTHLVKSKLSLEEEFLQLIDQK